MSQADRNSTTSRCPVEALAADAGVIAEAIDALESEAGSAFQILVEALRTVEDRAIETTATSMAGAIYQLRIVTRIGEDMLGMFPIGSEARGRADQLLSQMYRAIDAVTGSISGQRIAA